MKKKSYVYILRAVLCILPLCLLSCDGSNIVTDNNSDSLTTGNVNAIAAKKLHEDSPQKVFEEFLEMRKKVESMSKEEIDSLSDEEILDLGKPIIKITENTVKYDRETLKRLSEVILPVSEKPQSITKKQHQEITKEVREIITSENSRFGYRYFKVDEIREILIELNGGGGPVVRCNIFFNVQGSTVFLDHGDNFNHANTICPSGYTFYIMPGIHYQHSITGSKNGNRWFGVGATLDGQGSTKRAFKDGMDNNQIFWLEIRNYSQHGIISGGSENVLMLSLIFKNIGANQDGQDYGAIRFDNSENVTVQQSYFEDVASAVRFINSNGPLLVTYNTALNPGRNFFQCNNCTGGNIRINHNSMEHNEQVASRPLEDFINIFESSGLSSNYIQVNNNRARVNLVNGNAIGVSNSGCMIILGDYGGEYQEAKNNIGVNPGNCGIGLAGGTNFRVEENKMYSQQVIGVSNVGFYAANYAENPASITCSHPPSTFSNNQSSYICGQSGQPDEITNCGLGSNNFAWAPNSGDTYCGITFSQIRDDDRVEKNENLGPGIWFDW